MCDDVNIACMFVQKFAGLSCVQNLNEVFVFSYGHALSQWVIEIVIPVSFSEEFGGTELWYFVFNDQSLCEWQ
jgi:hypothetical protein